MPKLPDPPEQYSLIENFTDDNGSNINQIQKVLFSDPTDYAVAMEYADGILVGGEGNDYYDLSISGSSVVVGTGNCLKGGVLFETSSSKTLPVGAGDSYLYSTTGDNPPSVPGDYEIKVCLLYKPSTSNSAFIGLIRGASYYTSNSENLIILGYVDVTYSGGTNSITTVKYLSQDGTGFREIVGNTVDGGYVG